VGNKNEPTQDVECFLVIMGCPNLKAVFLLKMFKSRLNVDILLVNGSSDIQPAVLHHHAGW